MHPVFRLAVLLLAALLANAAAPARSAWVPSAPRGFHVEQIASVQGARELAFAPNGDLFVGTRGSQVFIIPRAGFQPGTARVFATIDDAPVAGVDFASGALYVGSQHAVWKLAYRPGAMQPASSPQKLAALRGGSPPAGSDGDVHTTTSVAVTASHVYVSVGSSCNACVETDPTRATIGQLRGGHYAVIAKRIRNAIALAIDPASQDLWASDAGQDELPVPHPFEFVDDVLSHPAPVDYGWPFCYENHRRKPGTSQNCSAAAIPKVVFPAYETPVGAVFYPQHQRGRFAFPKRYAGGIFVTMHGSWHGPAQGLAGYRPPRVIFVAMNGDKPAKPVDWGDPTVQWSQFLWNYQGGGSIAREGRPTGIAVGPQGDLFVADDQSGAVYRVRP